jgi:Ca2+-binding RTX toxin-like protein
MHGACRIRGAGARVTVWLLTIVAVWSVHAPATARAAVVAPDPNNPLGLLVQDTLAQANVMTVRAEPGTPATVVFEDTGATTTTTAPQCAVVATQVRCVSVALIGLDVQLGGGDDTFVLDESTYSLTSIFLTLISGEGGNDHLVTGAGNDFLFGGPGNDRLEAGAGNDNVAGADGADTANGGPGRDRVVGELDNDDLDGGPGNDVVLGGSGADIVRGGDGDDQVDEDTVESGAALGADTVDGGPGNDSLTGGPEGDPLSGDLLRGGDGDDTLSYAFRTSRLTITLDGAANDGAQGEGDDVGADIERVVGGSGADTLIGSGGANDFDGGPGDDRLDGLAGPDKLQGGLNDSGNDRAVGGPGNDVLEGDAGDDVLDGAADDDQVLGGGGTDTLLGGSGKDDLAGGPGTDDLAGGDGDDTLHGSDVVPIGADSADKLNGGPGEDVLLGGPGDDELIGGAGADAISGEDGNDTVSYEGRTTPIAVSFDGQPNDGAPGERDNVAVDVENVVGGNVDDTLSGDARPNRLSAGEGDDSLKGFQGFDTLLGGKGIDVITARDGERDDIFCGAGRDLAIVDRHDRIRGCDSVDRGRRRPSFRRSALVRSARGAVVLRLPGASPFVTVPRRVEAPLGSTLDARKAALRIVTASRRGGPLQKASFRGGRFTVLQPRGRPVTQLRLAGGDFSSCRAPGAKRKKVRRRLRTKIEKKPSDQYSVVGRHSIGGAVGTTWWTEDRCDGTLTRVIEGTVRVRDLRRHVTISVSAGHTYFAPAG